MSRSQQSRKAPDAPEDDRPAASKLTRDQADLLDELLDGRLETRSEVLRWMQQVSIHTLGQLGDGWYREQVTDPTVVSAFLGRPWGPLRDEDVDEEWLIEFRRDIAAKDLMGAFHAAAREFRWAASEFHEYEDDDDDLDPEEIELDEQHPGMRPSLGTLDTRQQNALEAVLDGFANPEHLLQWGQNVIRATYAEVEADVIRGAYFDVEMRRWLCGPGRGEARFHRETWAAKYLFPGFNRAASRLAARAQEQAVETGQEGHIPQ